MQVCAYVCCFCLKATAMQCCCHLPTIKQSPMLQCGGAKTKKKCFTKGAAAENKPERECKKDKFQTKQKKLKRKGKKRICKVYNCMQFSGEHYHCYIYHKWKIRNVACHTYTHTHMLTCGKA